MNNVLQLIKQIIYAIALIIACVFLMSKLSKSRFFENIKDRFSRDKETEQVEEIEEPGILDRYTHLSFKNVPITAH